MPATPIPTISEIKPTSVCPAISKTTAAVRPAAAASAGASQRSHPSSGVDSIRGSSWYNIGYPASYQLQRILPDADAVGRSEVQLLPRLHVEGLVPRIHVADDI